MPMYRLAELNTEITGIGTHAEEQLRPYLLPVEKMPLVPDISVAMTAALREKERRLEGSGFSGDYLESMAVYRSFCEQALKREVMFFHASAVEYQGAAYLFSGASGAGKSTHAAMWKKAFGEAAVVINDDKPLLRFFDRAGDSDFSGMLTEYGDSGTLTCSGGSNPVRNPAGSTAVYAYGTPWDGKRHLGCNLKIRVRGIAFLEKGDSVCIRRLGWQEALEKARMQCFCPETWENRQRYEMLLRRLLNTVPAYTLRCDISTRAAVTAYEAMKR